VLKKIAFYSVFILLLMLVTVAALEILARLNILPNLPYHNSDGWWREQYLREGQQYFTENSLAKYDPVLGWDLRENIDNLQRNGWAISSNNLGIRGKKQTRLQKSREKRAVVIGDSMTFGQGVEDDQTYAAYLEGFRQDYEVLNMAVMAYGQDQQLLKLKFYGLRLLPDVVILGFFPPDLERNATTFRDYEKPKFVLENDTVKLTNVPVKDPKHYQRFWDLRLLNYWKTMRDRANFQTIYKDTIKTTVWILAQMIAETQKAGAKMVIVYIPTVNNLTQNTPPYFLFTKICESPSVLCIDPTASIKEYLKTAPDPAAALNADSHYASQIHEVIARTISQALP